METCTQSLEGQSDGLHVRQAAVPLADLAGDATRQLHVVAVQVDVVGDERRGGRPRPRHRPSDAASAGTEVGRPLGVCDYGLAQPLELAATYLGQVAPLRPPSRLLIQIGGDAELRGRTPRHRLGGGHAERHVAVPQRHEGHHVGGAEARMGAAVHR